MRKIHFQYGLFLTLCTLLFGGVSMYGQGGRVENESRSIRIEGLTRPQDNETPAKETEKESPKITLEREEEPEIKLPSKIDLNRSPYLKDPNHEPEIQFAPQVSSLRDPSELWKEKVNRQFTKRTPLEEAMIEAFAGDQLIADFKTSSSLINVFIYDHMAEDGDLVKILQNDETKVPSVQLYHTPKRLTVPLKEGINKLDFQALNQGESGPNTAMIQVVDDKGNVLVKKQWMIITGFKATVIAVKE